MLVLLGEGYFILYYYLLYNMFCIMCHMPSYKSYVCWHPLNFITCCLINIIHVFRTKTSNLWSVILFFSFLDFLRLWTSVVGKTEARSQVIKTGTIPRVLLMTDTTNQMKVLKYLCLLIRVYMAHFKVNIPHSWLCVGAWSGIYYNLNSSNWHHH